MSHGTLPIADQHEKKVPNASFWHWVQSETAIFISQIASVLGIILYFASLFYYVGGGHSGSAHSEATDKYLTTVDAVILYANMAAALMFVIVLIQIYHKNDHGYYHVKVVSETLFKKNIERPEIELRIEWVKKLKFWFLTYWSYALLYYLAHYALFNFFKNDSGKFCALALNAIGPILLFECFKVIKTAEVHVENLPGAAAKLHKTVLNGSAKQEARKIAVEPSSVSSHTDPGQQLTSTSKRRPFWKGIGRWLTKSSIAIITVCYLSFIFYLCKYRGGFEFGESLSLWGNIIGSIINMVVIASLISRTDSALIGIPSLLISLISGYAVIQPLTIFFESHPFVTSLTYLLAFIFKIYFFSVLAYAMQTGRLLNYFCLTAELNHRVKPRSALQRTIVPWARKKLELIRNLTIGAFFLFATIAGIGVVIMSETKSASLKSLKMAIFGEANRDKCVVLYVSAFTVLLSLYFAMRLRRKKVSYELSKLKVPDFEFDVDDVFLTNQCKEGERRISVYFSYFWICMAAFYAVVIWSQCRKDPPPTATIVPVYHYESPLVTSLNAIDGLDWQDSLIRHHLPIAALFGVVPKKLKFDDDSGFVYSERHIYSSNSLNPEPVPSEKGEQNIGRKRFRILAFAEKDTVFKMDISPDEDRLEGAISMFKNQYKLVGGIQPSSNDADQANVAADDGSTNNVKSRQPTKIFLDQLSEKDKAMFMRRMLDSDYVDKILIAKHGAKDHCKVFEPTQSVDKARIDAIFGGKIEIKPEDTGKITPQNYISLMKNIIPKDTLVFDSSFKVCVSEKIRQWGGYIKETEPGLTFISYQYHKTIDNAQVFFEGMEFLLNNISLLFLFFCFIEFFTAHKHTELKMVLSHGYNDMLDNIRKRVRIFGGLVAAIMLLAYALLILRGMESSNAAAIADTQFVFDAISGLLNGIVFCLLIGRLDSKFMGLPNWVIMLLFVYPAIQPMFAGFSENKLVLEIALAVAFFCKVFFYLVVYHLLDTGRIFKYLYNTPFAGRAVDAVYQNYFEFVVEKHEHTDTYSFVIKKGGKVAFRTEAHAEHKATIITFITQLRTALKEGRGSFKKHELYGSHYVSYHLKPEHSSVSRLLRRAVRHGGHNSHQGEAHADAMHAGVTIESIEFRTEKDCMYFLECAKHNLQHCKVTADA